MRYKKVLLINPEYDRKTFAPFIFAGLGYIAEALKQNNIDYKVVDMNLGYKVGNVRDIIREYKPDLIGFQIMSLRYESIYEIINKIKDSFPDINIVAGGGHISLFRTKVLEECYGLDYGIILEGEEALVELCKGIELNRIKGLIYRISGRVIENPAREFVKDLDTIHFPTYTGFELDKYPEQLIHIVTSRGCPYSCGFCPVKQSIGQKLRVRSPKNVVDEIEYWHNKGIKHLGFVDDNFTFYRQRVIDICREIKARRLIGLKMLCGNGIRADKVYYEMLELMKEVGFYNICIGVESFNNDILNNMNKEETVGDIEKAISMCCELGFTVGLFFIIGYPGETPEKLQNSFDIALKYPVGYANFYNIMPFPKTPLYDYLDSNDYLTGHYELYLNKSGHYENVPCFTTPEMSYKERIKAFKDAKKVSNQVIKNRIYRQYSKYGIISKVVASIFVIDFVQKGFLSNPILKKVMNRFK